MTYTSNRLPREVISQSLILLSNENSWEKESNYGEICTPDSGPYTLGCALELAQIQVRGEKQARAREMRVIRRRILRHFFFRGHLHPITYFNRNKKTTYEEVVFILNESLKKLTK